MATKWKTVRVFISSTFSDMHSERDHLVKVVFPALRERLEKYRIHLVDIDLRWGLTEEQSENDKVLDLCLQQVDECRPLFLGILGERYGFVPKKFDESAVSRYGWIQHETGKSLTELEILHGVLKKHKMRSRAFFYFRDPAFVEQVPEAKQSVMQSEDSAAEKKLNRLKQAIREADLPAAPFENYPCRYRGLRINWRLVKMELDAADQKALHEIAEDGIVDSEEYATLESHLRDFADRQGTVCLEGLEEFGERIRGQIWDVIKAEHKLSDTPPTVQLGETDPLAEEADYHERFMESRLRVYVGREKLLNDLIEFANGDAAHPCLVTAPSGSGKSAAMARFTTTYREQNPNVLVIPHFVGASPGSTNLRQMLHRFCSILHGKFQFTEKVKQPDGKEQDLLIEIAQETNTLVDQFREFLGRVPVGQKILVAIDALNQLDETDNAHAVNWLPRHLPIHVKLVCSCINDADREESVLEAFEHIPHQSIEVGPLTDEERTQIIHEIPSLSAKTLDERQVQLLLKNPATVNPLFLLVALEELRGFGSYEQLNAHIEAFPKGADAVTDLFGQVLERLEEEFGKEAVRSLLILLASSRNGLSETELQGLLAGSIGGENLFPILRQTRAYLQPRGERIDFFHRGLFKAARDRYLKTHDEQMEAHRRLATYFHDLLNPAGETPWSGESIRGLSELPYHLTGAEDWSGVESILCDLRFLEAKCHFGMTYGLMRDFKHALNALPELWAIRQKARGYAEELTRYQKEILAYARLGDESQPVPEPLAHRPFAIETLHSNPGDLEKAPSDRASRIEAFAAFVASHVHMLNSEPAELIPMAYNFSSKGRVAEAAKQSISSLDRPWLARLIRPPEPPRRPLCRQVLIGHENTEAVAMTADGRRALSIGTGFDSQRKNLIKTVILWDLETGEKILELNKNTKYAKSVAISADGERGLTVGMRPAALVWDLRTGSEICRIEGNVNQEHFGMTPDGRILVSCGVDMVLRIWNLDAGVEVDVIEGLSDIHRQVVLSPCGRQAVCSCDDKSLRVWDLERKQETARMCGHTSPISSLALSGDGRRVVSASEKDQSIRVWDLETGEQVLLIQGKEPHEFQKVCITADGLRAVSAGHRNLIGIMGGWNLETGVKIFENVFGYVIDGGRGLSLNADGSTALRIADQNLAVYDLAGGYVGAEYRDHMGPVTAVALAPNGTHAASGGRDRTLKVWDLDAQKKMGELSGHTHEISCVAIAQDGSMIVSGCEFDALRIWNLADMKQESEIDANNPLLEEWELTAKVKELYPILRDGGINDEVYHGKLRDRIWKWNIGRSDGTKKSRADRKLEAVLETIDWNAIDHSHIMLTENARGVARIALTHDGRYAVCVDFAADVETPRVWSLDLRTSQPTSTFIGHSGQEIEGPVILADDKRVVTGGHAGELHVWNLKNGEGLKKLLFPKRLRVGGFAVTAKGDRAIVFYRVGFQQTKDTAIRVWNLNKGREEFVLEGHTSEISGVAITPDGHRAVSVGGGGILNVWDLNAGTLIATIETEKMAGSFLSITDDGRWAISGWGRDNSIRVWDLEYACQAAAYFTSAPIMRMASSSSGYALAVGCSDGQVHFLNLRTDSTSSSRTDGQRSKSLFGRLFGVGRVETPSRSTEETASDRSAVTAISAVTVFCACVYSMIIIDGEEDDGEMLILSRAVPDATLINQGIKYYRDHGLEHLLKEVGGILNEDQKRCLMVNLIAVALEDGRLRTKEQELLEQFRQALNISEADYQRTHEILLRKANLTVLAEPVDGEVPALTLFCASLLGMAAADADFDATEKEYVKRLVANPDALQEGADYFSQAGIDTVVKGAGLHLNEEQKLCLMSNLMALAMADGLLRGVEQQLVERFREALHINEEDYSAMHEVLMVLRNYSVFG